MRRRVDKARLKVGCLGPEDIPSSMSTIIKELSFKLRFKVEKTPKDGGDPSRSTAFKRLFSNLGVAGEGRSSPSLNQHPKDVGPSLDQFIKKTKAKTAIFRFQ